MKNLFLPIVMVFAGLAACNDDESIVTIDSARPDGTFASMKSGSFVEQNGTGSKGMVELGNDSGGVQFLRFGSDFNTNLGTGTVTVYLSTSKDFNADPANGNPDLRLIGVVNKAGEMFFKMEPAAAAKFTHVILWCGSANIPFGYAAIN